MVCSPPSPTTSLPEAAAAASGSGYLGDGGLRVVRQVYGGQRVDTILHGRFQIELAVIQFHLLRCLDDGSRAVAGAAAVADGGFKRYRQDEHSGSFEAAVLVGKA